MAECDPTEPREPNERLFRSAADAAADGIVLVDMQGCILYINQSRARMHGYDRDELIGKRVDMLISPESDPERIMKAVSSQGDWHGESIGVRKDGSTFPMRQTITRIAGSDGTAAAMLSITRDISLEKRTQQRAEEAEIRYKSLVENSIVAICRASLEGEFTYINDAGVALYGAKSREEMLGRRPYDFCVDKQVYDRLLERLKRGDVVTGEEVGIRTLAGEMKTVLVSAWLGIDNVVSAMLVDITQMKRFELGMRRMTDRLVDLLEVSRELNAALDSEQVLRLLVSHGMSLISAEGGAAGLLKQGAMVFTEYNRGGELIPINYTFRGGYGVPGWVMQNREPYVTNDAPNDPQVIPHIQRAIGFHRLIDLPIVSSDGRMLGCVEIHNFANGREFTDEDVQLLSGLVNQAAVALENALLADDLKRYAEKVEKNEETLKLVVEGSPDFFFYIHDARGFFTYVSPSVELITGHTAEEWKSHYTRFLTDNPINEQAIEYTESMLHTGEATPPYLVEVRHSDGRGITLEVYERPILRGGAVAGIRGVARDVTELKQAEERERALREESEAHKRRFYRDTIYSVTDGKLVISEPEETRTMCESPLFPQMQIEEPCDIPMARDEICHTARKAGMEPSQVDLLALAVGEATTNALKHAGGGSVCVTDTGDALRVGVFDEGPGMDSLALPMLTLKRGFSTQRSLGMGYATILAASDKVYLSTGPRGTVVVAEVSKHPRETSVEVCNLPDLW